MQHCLPNALLRQGRLESAARERKEQKVRTIKERRVELFPHRNRNNRTQKGSRVAQRQRIGRPNRGRLRTVNVTS